MTDQRPAEGDPAPDFTLPGIGLPDDAGDGALTLGRLARPAVLFFYPKDDTSGCTAEALDFTRLAPDFAAAGIAVLGISKDPLAAHGKFRDKHGLTVALLSDAGGDVAERYDVWTEKKMYGRTYMGIERSTFLVDAGGRIARVWRKVSVPGHAEAVLEAARAL